MVKKERSYGTQALLLKFFHSYPPCSSVIIYERSITIGPKGPDHRAKKNSVGGPGGAGYANSYSTSGYCRLCTTRK